MSIDLKPCRFCGETELLEVHPGYGEWIAFDGDELARGADGKVLCEDYDAVDCLQCCTTAPLVIWQGDVVLTTAQRAAYAAYLREPPSEDEWVALDYVEAAAGEEAAYEAWRLAHPEEHQASLERAREWWRARGFTPTSPAPSPPEVQATAPRPDHTPVGAHPASASES